MLVASLSAELFSETAAVESHEFSVWTNEPPSNIVHKYFPFEKSTLINTGTFPVCTLVGTMIS